MPATFEFEKGRDFLRFVETHLELEKVWNLLDFECAENRSEYGIFRFLKFTCVQNQVEHTVRVQIE